jgi:hypothetical protein
MCKKKEDADTLAENFEKVYYDLEKQEIDELCEEEEEADINDKNYHDEAQINTN